MKLDGKFYRIFETIYDFFLLNFIWLVACLPIITIFPATTAMFGVIRQWKTKNDGRVLKPFVQFFKENLKQSMFIELIFALAIYLLIIDFSFTSQLDSSFKLILMPVFILLAALLLFTFAFIFPVSVQFQANWKAVIRNSFLFSISHLPLTISSLFVMGVVGLTVWVFPISFLIVFSMGAYMIYSFCHRAFQKLTLLNGTINTNQES